MRQVSKCLVVLMLGLAACASAAAAAAKRGGEDYRLGAGDLLKISTFGYADLAADVRISESGNITFPLIGQIAAEGLSTRELETVIAQRLQEGNFIRGAQVSVLIVEYLSQKVSVLGQVGKPGQYFLDGTTRVLDLLAKAGGVAEDSGGDQAVLLRPNGSSQTLDLAALFRGDATQNPVVSDGDTVNVLRAPRFYIYGEVQKPGAYRLERNMTLSRAITAGGGLTPRGSERRVIVKRRDAQGRELTKSIGGAELLKEDDVVYVKESLF
jgi:polysaccharide export outer membrane protein